MVQDQPRYRLVTARTEVKFEKLLNAIADLRYRVVQAGAGELWWALMERPDRSWYGRWTRTSGIPDATDLPDSGEDRLDD